LGSVGVDAVVVASVVDGAAALTALAPLEATSLPPPQDTRPKVITNIKVVIYVRMIFP
jgi:hypothetical protein